MYNKNFRSLLGAYFLAHGFEDYRRGWLKGPYFSCPFCGREGKLGVNPSTDFYHCFRCNSKGNLLDLVLILERLETFNEGLKVLENDSILEKGDTVVLAGGAKILPGQEENKVIGGCVRI